jgi:peptide/nickel transport system permease protein
MTTSAELLPALESHKEESAFKRMLGEEGYRKFKTLITNPLAVFGISLLIFFIIVGALAPVLAPPANPNKPYAIPRDGFNPVPRPPGAEWKVRQPPLPFWWETVTGETEWFHPFGTASGQYDIYYGVIWGVRTAFFVGLIVTGAGLLVGMTVGSISAYYGGTIDQVLMRITDIFLSFPFLVAALTFSAILTPRLGRGIWPPLVAIICFGWMGYARLIRGDILAVREREFVTAARVIGTPDYAILIRHILPNAIFPTLIVASLRIGTVVITFAGLSFLGVGVDKGYADWGQLISFARDWVIDLNTYWYIVFFPGMAIVFFVMAWNLVGDALRDVFDPRLRGS